MCNASVTLAVSVQHDMRQEEFADTLDESVDVARLMRGVLKMQAAFRANHERAKLKANEQAKLKATFRVVQWVSQHTNLGVARRVTRDARTLFF